MKIRDNETGEIFEYGTNIHHALRISKNGGCLTFENLQNGDGSLKSGDGGYSFVLNDGKTPEESSSPDSMYGATYANIGGFHEHLSRENGREITRSSRDNDVTEYCPHCDREITVLWDVEQDGYQIFCPNCGEPIMLCSMCDREPCDWTENGCKYSDNRYGKRKDGRGKDEADT